MWDVVFQDTLTSIDSCYYLNRGKTWVAFKMDKFMNLCMEHKFVHNPLLPTGGGFGN